MQKQYYTIEGGRRLEGTVHISGAKNAAVALIPASLLAEEPCILENLPRVEDIHTLVFILRALGVKVEYPSAGTMRIDPNTVNDTNAVMPAMAEMRASYYLLGALLGRYGEAQIRLPGGCAIGARPIDQHLKGMEALGAQIDIDPQTGILTAKAKKLVGAEIFFDCVSVGATINVMLAASRAEGTTVLSNVAKEPHVVDVANFLNMMGASVRGAGTDVIRITGKPHLHGCVYAVIPDQIETGTYMIAAAATLGDVTIKNVIPAHMEAVSAKLMESGARVIEGDDGRDFFLRVTMENRPRAVNVKTMVYPGFPTDLQQPMMAYLTTASGQSIVTENIYENRFNHVRELRRMGASISLRERIAKVKGVTELHGAEIYASDLRAGAALFIAGLMAKGTSNLYNIGFIDRGYEDIAEKFNNIGASVCRSAKN